LQNASVAPTIASFDTALSETGEHRPTSASAIAQECAAGADSGGDLRRGVVVGEHGPAEPRHQPARWIPASLRV
jgi:hypothetical protein